MSLPPSKVIGCDFSGVVTALGKQVPATSFSIGDRVAGVIHGCKDSHTGAFAETLVADANMCFKLPKTADKDSDMAAVCTLGVGWISAAQALRQRLYKDDKTPDGKEDTVSFSVVRSKQSRNGTLTCTIASYLLRRNQYRHARNPASSPRLPLYLHHRPCFPTASRVFTQARCSRDLRLQVSVFSRRCSQVGQRYPKMPGLPFRRAVNCTGS